MAEVVYSAFRHIVYAPGPDGFTASIFPGLVDLLADLRSQSKNEAANTWEKIKQHLATVTFAIDTAASVLEPANEI